MKTSEVLTKAKQLISNPEKWIQGDYTNGQGCFCALGAISQVALVSDSGNVWYGNAFETKAGRLLRKVVDVELTEANYSEGTTFAAYNDGHNHTEVMKAFDKAIQLAIVEEES